MQTALKTQVENGPKSIDSTANSAALAKATAAYNILTNSKMRREQPSNPWKMKETMASTIAESNTIKLSGFWGGFKENETGRADEADITALDRIKQTVEALEKLELEVKVNLIFSDNTSRNRSLGRTKDRHSKEYFGDIKTLAEERGFTIEPFSNHLRKFDTFNTLFFYKVSKKKKEFEHRVGQDVVERLLNAAKEHTDMVSNKPNKIVKICNNYIKYRISEAMFMDKYFKDTIFFAYGYPYKDLFTDRTIFWYSIKKGVSAQPWFVDGKKFDIGKWFAQEKKNSLYYDWLDARALADKVHGVFESVSAFTSVITFTTLTIYLFSSILMWACPSEKKNYENWVSLRNNHPKAIMAILRNTGVSSLSWKSPKTLQRIYDECLRNDPTLTEENKTYLSEHIGLDRAKEDVEYWSKYIDGLTDEERKEFIYKEFAFSHTTQDSPVRYVIRKYLENHKG